MHHGKVVIVCSNRAAAFCLVVAFCQAAIAQECILGLPSKPAASQGTLIVGGGGKLPDAVYDEFVKLAGGKTARLVHIPWAHPFSNLKTVKYRYSGWKEYDVQSFDFLGANSRQEAEDNRAIAVLEKATGVWIGGGTQGRLVNFYRGTKVEAALRRVLERGGVIGGTSAGAAVLSQTMIRYSESHEATVDTGFDLLRAATVDQHFSQRGRHTRLVGVLDKHPELIGIGVDEGTALFVTGDQLRTIGKSQVSLFVPTLGRQPTLLYRLRDGDRGMLERNGKTGQVSLSLQAG